MRTESERYNSRLKDLNLKDASVRNFALISNLNTLGHICLLTAALKAIKLDQLDKTKSLAGLKRSAKGNSSLIKPYFYKRIVLGIVYPLSDENIGIFHLKLLFQFITKFLSYAHLYGMREKNISLNFYLT